MRKHSTWIEIWKLWNLFHEAIFLLFLTLNWNRRFMDSVVSRKRFQTEKARPPTWTCCKTKWLTEEIVMANAREQQSKWQSSNHEMIFFPPLESFVSAKKMSRRFFTRLVSSVWCGKTSRRGTKHRYDTISCCTSHISIVLLVVCLLCRIQNRKKAWIMQFLKLEKVKNCRQKFFNSFIFSDHWNRVEKKIISLKSLIRWHCIFRVRHCDDDDGTEITWRCPSMCLTRWSHLMRPDSCRTLTSHQKCQ